PSTDLPSEPDSASDSQTFLPELTGETPEPATSFLDSQPHDRPFRPLALLRSLFSDRLELLVSTLRHLEEAEKERKALVDRGLEEIDERIEACEEALSLFRRERVLNNLEQRRHLERHLMELKRQRRQELVWSWRDLIWLKREIANLQRQVAALQGRVDETSNADQQVG
ncbi:MAG: hypothetical protein QI223_10170, partial [Candidatus Korarchaeota archaeon]|nr:hypothetical protein [Candidatus Korarchaeota archaeon]